MCFLFPPPSLSPASSFSFFVKPDTLGTQIMQREREREWDKGGEEKEMGEHEKAEPPTSKKKKKERTLFFFSLLNSCLTSLPPCNIRCPRVLACWRTLHKFNFLNYRTPGHHPSCRSPSIFISSVGGGGGGSGGIRSRSITLCHPTRRKHRRTTTTYYV